MIFDPVYLLFVLPGLALSMWASRRGRRRWKKEAGYHLQARVENAFFRYKSILGDRLRARSRGGRVAESVVACNVLNQMTELGRPESYSIGR